MGLFRRGTQLLRLGSGLRDCCCRPEKPEECWCPDLCRYYWDWGGDDYVPAGTLFRVCDLNCFSNSENVLSSPSIQAPYGLLGGNIVASGGVTSGEGNGVVTGKYIPVFNFSYDMIIRGDAPGYENIFAPARPFFDPIAIYSTLIYLQLGPLCPKTPGEAALWFVFAAIIQGITIGSRRSFSDEKSDRVTILSTQKSLEFTVPAVCIKNAKFWCCPPLPQFEKAGLHLNGPLELQIDGSGVTTNGVSYPWIQGFLIDRNIEQANVEGDFPFDRTVVATVLSRDSCLSGPCDCDLDLTGRTVVFEGRTFTYGSLQQFISDDGLTIWEEGPSAGTFTREDRRECDPTVSMRIRKAEVSCSTFDGVPRWFVYLDSECYERENGGCAPTVTASKITLYNGALSCDSDGYPLGAAHSFTDDTDPPDLDGENISGTPSANCDVENPIPSISFS